MGTTKLAKEDKQLLEQRWKDESERWRERGRDMEYKYLVMYKLKKNNLKPDAAKIYRA